MVEHFIFHFINLVTLMAVLVIFHFLCFCLVFDGFSARLKIFFSHFLKVSGCDTLALIRNRSKSFSSVRRITH